MADGDNNTSSGGDNKDGKRRYFRRRKPTEGSGGASERSTTDGPERKATEGRSGNRTGNRTGGGKAGEPRGASPQGKAGARRRSRRPRSGSSNAPRDTGNGPSGADSAPSNAGGNANKPRTDESTEAGANRRARRTNRPERTGRPERSDRPERGERADNNRRSNRSRRKRRSSGQEAPTAVQMVTESTIDAIAHEYEAPKAVFVYTHVSRPSYQGMPDYRTEHFPRTGRTLADFHVDISPLFDEAGNMLPPGTFRRADEGVKEDTFTEGDWEEAEE